MIDDRKWGRQSKQAGYAISIWGEEKKDTEMKKQPTSGRTLRLGSWNTLTCRESPDAMARAYLWDLYLTLRGRVRVFQERLLKSKQRAWGLSPRGCFVSRKNELYYSKVEVILNCKPKESTNAFSVPLPSASENRESRVGHEGPLPSWVISLARVSHVFGKVGAMLQSTVEGLVCLEQSPAMWPGFSDDTGLLRALKNQ
ncbi:hypothetical protein WN51_01863 [Melipona quadrifasciata]|uniref:Uncharacterized protein n=1 Tax=Melipona quadrifasciata TaxID=166423 RepID=A0A0M8ZZQ9_9HYME|nr:hypothetical protein WN51_01863 [Melipona quadrifasciata]